MSRTPSDEPDPSREPAPDEPPRPSADAAPSRSRGRQLLRFGMQVLIALSVFLAVSHWQTRRLLPAGDAPAPDFALTDLEGNTVRLSDFAGKTVLLHFWATWCGVCRHEVGALNDLASSLGDDQVLLTVAADGDNVAGVRRFIEERGARYPVLLGNDGVIDAYRINVFPTNYFIDPKGRITASTVGMSTRWSLKTRMSCAK